MPAGPRHVAGGLGRPLQHLEPPGHNRVCSAFVIASPCRTFSTNEDAVDAAVPVDAQNAPTRTWKLQNSFHSANSAHPLFEKDLNPNRREPGVSTLSWDFTVTYLSGKDSLATRLQTL